MTFRTDSPIILLHKIIIAQGEKIMKTRKLLLSAIAITLVMSTLSGCSFFAVKKVLNKSDEVFNEGITQTEETEDINDKGFLGLFDKTEEETTRREYVEIDTIDSVEEFKDLVSPLIDLSAYDISEVMEGDSIGVSYTMKEDLIKQTSYNFKNNISLGDGTEIVLPTTVGELKEQGWSVSEDNIFTGNVYMTNSDGNEIQLFLDSSTNYGNVDEYIINGYNINTYENNRNIEYTVYDKLTEESDFIEIIEHFGAPTIIRFAILDDGYDEAKTIELFYIEGENLFKKEAYFMISCGTNTYDGKCKDYNGRQIKFHNKSGIIIHN